jgi:hypothetical protein
MTWDVVLPAWVALLEADAALVAALGGAHIYPAQAARAVRIPSVEYVMVDDREGEVFNPLIVQVDYWARGVGAAGLIEQRIRRVTHRDTARTVDLGDDGMLTLWMRYIDSRSHDYTAERGVVHRSMDFRFETVRATAHMGPDFTP